MSEPQEQQKNLCQVCQAEVEAGTLVCGACLDRQAKQFFDVRIDLLASHMYGQKLAEFRALRRVEQERQVLDYLALGGTF